MKTVETIRAKEPRVGTRKLVDRLHKHHATKVGRDRLFDLLRNAGRLVKVKKVLFASSSWAAVQL